MIVRNPFSTGKVLTMLAAAVLSARLAAAAQVGTAFTYQGQLSNGGTPQNGPCDFRFKLFDAATSGAQVGATQTLTGVPVSNGLFTVSIDFGSAFVGFGRWLETGVACPSGGSITTLSPRQAMSPAPNAIYAENASVQSDGATVTGNGTADAPLSLQNPLGLSSGLGHRDHRRDELRTGDGDFRRQHRRRQRRAGAHDVGRSVRSRRHQRRPRRGRVWTGKPGGAGLYGNGTATGDGVYGRGDGANGVEGYSQFGTGVRGSSGLGSGVWGSSTTFDGVHGDTGSNHSGVAGLNSAIGARRLRFRRRRFLVRRRQTGSTRSEPPPAPGSSVAPGPMRCRRTSRRVDELRGHWRRPERRRGQELRHAASDRRLEADRLHRSRRSGVWNLLPGTTATRRRLCRSRGAREFPTGLLGSGPAPSSRLPSVRSRRSSA